MQLLLRLKSPVGCVIQHLEVALAISRCKPLPYQSSRMTIPYLERNEAKTQRRIALESTSV
ncbi:hypothetical protein BDV11DRAFT_195550, partial [Aspergillus similis]